MEQTGNRQLRVSIVIASETGEGDVRDCLASLAGQLTPADEVIVVGSPGADSPGADGDGSGMALTLVKAPPGASIPDLRYRGLERAGGAIVAMTEAPARFTPGWLEHVVALHGRGFDAVGGAIDPSGDLDLVSWAAHVCEYGAYMSPVTDEDGGDFSGFHAAYSRALLQRCGTSIEGRHWETVLHEEARRRGGRFLRSGSLRLLNDRRHTVGSFLRQRLSYGRGYGKVRARRIPARAHFALLLAVVGLPALMMWRYARWGLAKSLSRRRLVAATPLLLMFAVAWSIGEWLGYVEALPGRLRGFDR